MASLCFESHESSSSRHGCTYDVFLSFRGADTRKRFANHLYAALDQAGIYAFWDDNELSLGEEISPHLLQAIQGSKISIVVFSKGYASSRWCLGELIFKKRWNFSKAFDGHEEAFKIETVKVKRWREALEEAKNLSGWTFKVMTNGYVFLSNIQLHS
ncbi:unnamed protein product [Dovyalis caffra]|uniref:TIR domain-containing protein n=1 Tax=Dovyalis caffra TaxID=77055 RepID=A0AAV1RLC5_9ROSI|nr:unnamed protein product [Dovyalis caffra]